MTIYQLVIFIGFSIVSCNKVTERFFDFAYSINSQVEQFQDYLVLTQENILQEFNTNFATQFVSKRKEKELNYSSLYKFDNTKGQIHQERPINTQFIERNEPQKLYNNQNICFDNEVCISRRILKDSEKEVNNQNLKDEKIDNHDEDDKNPQNTIDDDNQNNEENNYVDAFYDQEDNYLKYFNKYSTDEQFMHYYSKEYLTLSLQYRQNENNENNIDREYQVPTNLVYTKSFKNQQYKIVKLQGQCNNKSQKVIEKRYIYFCESKKVYINNFLRARSDPNKYCYKQVAYFESCLCPIDKYGVLCNDQVKIDCQLSKENQQQQNKSENKNSSINQNQNGQQINGKEPTYEQVEVFTNEILKFNSEEFNFNLSCQNHESITEKLKELYLRINQYFIIFFVKKQRFKQIDGLCPDKDNMQNDCYIKKFNYTYENKQSNLFISDEISLKVTLSIANWRIISQPYLIEFFINNTTKEMMIGSQQISIPLNTNQIQELYPKLNINDFFQSGKMWYTLKVSFILNPTPYSQYEINIQRFSGIFQQTGYEEPKLNYYQLLLINKWTYTDLILITITILLLITIINLIIYIFKKFSKMNLLHKFLTYVKIRKFNKRQQMDMEMTSNVNYKAFQDETKD